MQISGNKSTLPGYFSWVSLRKTKRRRRQLRAMLVFPKVWPMKHIPTTMRLSSPWGIKWELSKFPDSPRAQLSWYCVYPKSALHIRRTLVKPSTFVPSRRWISIKPLTTSRTLCFGNITKETCLGALYFSLTQGGGIPISRMPNAFNIIIPPLSYQEKKSKTCWDDM